MKTLGLVGGADTKLQVAMDLGIHVIVIDRPRVKLESHVVSSNDEFFKSWEDTMDYVKNPKAIEDKSMEIIYDYVKDLGLQMMKCALYLVQYMRLVMSNTAPTS